MNFKRVKNVKIIPTSLFEIVKPLIFVEIPYCELNEIKSKHFFEEI